MKSTAGEVSLKTGGEKKLLIANAIERLANGAIWSGNVAKALLFFFFSKWSKPEQLLCVLISLKDWAFLCKHFNCIQGEQTNKCMQKKKKTFKSAKIPLL